MQDSQTVTYYRDRGTGQIYRIIGQTPKNPRLLDWEELPEPVWPSSRLVRFLMRWLS